MINNLINDIEQIGEALYSLARGQSKLFLLEAKLAKQSLAPFAIVVGLILIISLSAWFCFELLLGYILYIYTHNIMVTIILTLFINIIWLVLLINRLMVHRKNMAFTQTRHHIKSMVGNENENEQQ